MRAIDRAWSALCAGRPPADVAARVSAALALAALLYATACLFLILEPGR